MSLLQSHPIPPGWIGGFAQSNPQFSYPDPNLSSLPMLGNMDNISLLRRQQSVKWPEFSWLTVPGDDNSRCFQMFAPYISRLGYDNRGRIYSIICPQQGVWIGDMLCLNVEVTVTGVRGWVDESTREMAGDITVEGRVWFTPGQHQGAIFKDLWNYLRRLEPQLPMDKDHAIRVPTFKINDPQSPIFPIHKGQTQRFATPEFTHHPEAWTVANLDVEIGSIKLTDQPVVDEFNELVMEAFNLGSGNLLQPGNVLTWNVWFTEPELVNESEWRNHAGLWRKSIDEHHGSPDGPGSIARYFNGSPFSAAQADIEEIIQKIVAYIKKLI